MIDEIVQIATDEEQAYIALYSQTQGGVASGMEVVQQPR
jgi:hypothetical protein